MCFYLFYLYFKQFRSPNGGRAEARGESSQLQEQEAKLIYQTGWAGEVVN